MVVEISTFRRRAKGAISNLFREVLILIVTAGNNKHLPVRFTQLENN
jgi:hypothetical protein